MYRFVKLSVLVVIVLVLAVALSACGGEPTPTAAPTEVVQQPADTPIPPTEAPPTDTPLPTNTPIPPTDTPAPTDTPIPPTDTPIPPTDTSIPPTDTPEPTATLAPTATPTEEASPVPEATDTPIPPTPAPKPSAGKIVFTSNRASWDDVFIMDEDGSDVKRLTQMGRCYDAHFTPDGKTIVFYHRDENDDRDVWKMNADGSGQVNLTNTTDNLELFPVVSPDGKRIAYLFAWPGGFEIYTMKLDGSDRKPITSQNIDFEPGWSPDSQKIAFASIRSGSWNIWMVNRDGSNLTQVTKFGPERVSRSPIFSPDGSRIAFTTISAETAWEIWVVNTNGSNAHRVVGAVGNDPNNSTFIAAWKQGKFLIGGYQGRWDPYFIADGGGEPVRVPASEKDDKPSDWYIP